MIASCNQINKNKYHEKKLITVTPSEAEDAAPVSYDITKLNKREMSWKMVGATENSYGYDIIHFVREE